MLVQIVAADTQHDAEIADGDHGRAADPGNRAGVAQTDIAEFGGQPDGGKYPQHQFGNAWNHRDNRAPHALQAVAEDENLPEEEVKQNADVL